MSSLSPDARKLLDRSRGAGGPTSAQRAAMKHAVLAAVVVPGTAAAASTVAGGAKATGLALAAKLGVVVVAVAVGAALVWPAASPKEEVRAPVVAKAEVKAVEPEPVAPPEVAIVEPAPAAVSPPIIPRAVEGRPSVPPPPVPVAPEPVVNPAPEAPSAAVDEATLSREIAALSGAMGAVDSKSFTVALEQLSHYRAAFPSGLLETEASVLEVLALCGLGRVDEARAAGHTLPANNPAVRRLERSCIAAARK